MASVLSVLVTSCVVTCHTYSSGQVGVGSLDDVTTPTLLASLNSQVVRAVVCGQDHTVALTEVLHGCVSVLL